MGAHDMRRFGDILAELREDRGLSQKQLGALIFVSGGTISNYENGVHYPDVEKLIQLANYFGVTVDYLLGRCTVNLSVDVWEEDLLKGQTTGKVIQNIRDLTTRQKIALATVLHDMHLSAMVGQYGKVNS